MAQGKNMIAGADQYAGGILFEDFLQLPTDSVPSPWGIQDTSVAGSPTADTVADQANGLFRLATDAQSEAQTLTLYHQDQLTIDPTKNPFMETRIRLNTAGATFTADQRLVVGLAAARNATLDSNASHCWFRIEGADLSLFIEGDDGTTDTDDEDSGIDYVDNTFITLGIDMMDLSAVKFYVDGVQVVTTIDVSGLAATNLLQPYIEMQRDAGTEVEVLDIDYILVRANR